MLAKATTLLAILGVAAQFTLATPPACVIAAVNTQQDPSDLDAVCSGSAANQVGQYICRNCGDNTDIAASAFSEVCSSAGVELADSAVPCSSASGSDTPSGSPTEHTGGTGGATGTAPSASATTSNAAVRSGIDLVGMGVVGVFGAMLAL